MLSGNGGFSASSRGYAAAPNKGLRDALRRWFPIVLVDENYTSQRCANPGCGQAQVKHGKREVVSDDGGPTITTKKIWGMFHCPICKTTWDRDTCAAISILRIFQFQSNNHDAANPLLRPLKYYPSEDQETTTTTSAPTTAVVTTTIPTPTLETDEDIVQEETKQDAVAMEVVPLEMSHWGQDT